MSRSAPASAFRPVGPWWRLARPSELLVAVGSTVGTSVGVGSGPLALPGADCGSVRAIGAFENVRDGHFAGDDRLLAAGGGVIALPVRRSAARWPDRAQVRSL